MEITHETSGLIADDPDEFARAIRRLFHDDSLWRSLSELGMNHVEATFGVEQVREAIRAIPRLVDGETVRTQLLNSVVAFDS